MSKKIIFLAIIFVILLGTILFSSFCVLQKLANENLNSYLSYINVSNQTSSLETKEIQNDTLNISQNEDVITVELPRKRRYYSFYVFNW